MRPPQPPQFWGEPDERCAESGRFGGDGRAPLLPNSGGRTQVAAAGRGRNLKNTKRSSPGGHFGRFGYVKAPRAHGERARWAVAAPCSADRAGGGRAWEV